MPSRTEHEDNYNGFDRGCDFDCDSGFGFKFQGYSNDQDGFDYGFQGYSNNQVGKGDGWMAGRSGV